jgi:DNA replication and repair protein RecF
MILKSMSIRDFRNYKSLDIDFNSRLTFFIGENGEGKTNFLESIQMLSTLKSFRDNSDDEILSWNSDTFYLSGSITKDIHDIKLELGYTKKESKRKKIKLNGNEISKKIDFIGNLVTVVFSPLDLKIIDGGPAERRKLLDTILSTINKNYLINILEYNKILKHRNSLLKNKTQSAKEFIPWEKMLVERGISLMEERKNLVLFLSEKFKNNLLELSGAKDDFEIFYKPNIKNIDTYSELLSTRRDLDFRLGYTSIGPHRDDLFIGKENRDITEFGSQGQKRSTVISLRTAQFQYVKEKIKDTPVLLIDDVIRELDIKRREYFVNLLLGSGQAFFTTTDLEGIKDYIGDMKEKVQIFTVKTGEMEEVSIESI